MPKINIILTALFLVALPIGCIINICFSHNVYADAPLDKTFFHGTQLYNLDAPQKNTSQNNTSTLPKHSTLYNLDKPERNNKPSPGAIEKLSPETENRLNNQLFHAVTDLRHDNKNPAMYQTIKGLLKAGADPLFKHPGDTIDVFHIFLINKSKYATGYKSTKQIFLQSLQKKE